MKIEGDETYTTVNLNSHVTLDANGAMVQASSDTAIAVADAIKKAGDNCKVTELHMSCRLQLCPFRSVVPFNCYGWCSVV
jgi:hypothetical protein